MIKFEKLPFVVRQAAVTTLGFRNYPRRYGTEYRDWSEFLQVSQTWSLHKQQSWQRDRLLGLLKDAKTGTDYYADVLPDVNSCDSEASLEEIIALIPILEKSKIKAL